MDGDEEFRFISFNIPNLNYVEDDMTFTRINPYDLPNEFEMRDAFETIKEMGGQAIRIYTIPVRNTNFPAEAPTHVEAPGKFNEEAFKANGNGWEEHPIMLNSGERSLRISGKIKN